MIRTLSVFLLFLLACLATAEQFDMSFIRMCAAFPNESCSELAAVPGPCHNPHKCVDMACDPKRPGNCVVNPSLTGCDEIECPSVVRQKRDVLGKLSRRFAKTA